MSVFSIEEVETEIAFAQDQWFQMTSLAGQIACCFVDKRLIVWPRVNRRGLGLKLQN